MNLSPAFVRESVSGTSVSRKSVSLRRFFNSALWHNLLLKTQIQFDSNESEWRQEDKLMRYLILGTVKSDGSLEIFTICGLLGNFSNIRKRKGSFSFVSALASLCFSCGDDTQKEKKRKKKQTTTLALTEMDKDTKCSCFLSFANKSFRMFEAWIHRYKLGWCTLTSFPGTSFVPCWIHFSCQGCL